MTAGRVALLLQFAWGETLLSTLYGRSKSQRTVHCCTRGAIGISDIHATNSQFEKAPDSDCLGYHLSPGRYMLLQNVCNQGQVR
jgi:hypothetical protein